MKNYQKRCVGAACLGASVVGAGSANAATLVFRDGLAGYAGTQDTWFSNRASEAGGFPTGAFVRTAMWGTPPGHTDGANQQGLVRFDGIFGANLGQIPQGSSITSAVLRLHVPSDITYADGEANAVHQMLVDWVETDAFNAPQWSAGNSGHIDRDDVEAAAIAVADSTAFAAGGVIPQNTSITFDVTSILQSWSANAGTNYGFLLQSLGLVGGNGLFMASSEYAGADGEVARPTLIVEGDFPGNVISMTVDRDTREVTITNGTGIAQTEILGYVISSEVGALDQTGWLTVADNYDQSAGGPIDLNDDWTVVTDPDSRTDLSEFEFDGDGGIFADGVPLNLGPVWIQNPVEDLGIVLVKTNGTELNVEVSFVGNDDNPFEPGDFNFDGVVNASDWPIFRDNHLIDMSNLSGAQSYQLGDLDGDFDNDEIDYATFKQIFEDSMGSGSFARMLTGIPEPSSMILMISASAALLFGSWRSTSRRSWLGIRKSN